MDRKHLEVNLSTKSFFVNEVIKFRKDVDITDEDASERAHWVRSHLTSNQQSQREMRGNV